MVFLLVALGIDNVGSGLFLPMTIVYATRVVGLPLAAAGVTVTVGTLVGLLVPPLAGRLVDRVGPRPVVIASQVLQACGALGFVGAGGAGGLALTVCLLAAGQQLFYSSLFALLSDVVGDRPKDRPFAVVAMVRSACFGLGGLLAAWLLSVGALRVAPLVNVVSFVVCAVILAVFVRAPHAVVEADRGGRVSGQFLRLVLLTGLVAVGLDFFLVGIPVFVLGLGAPSWLPGVILALNTVVTSTCGTLAVRLTQRFARTTALAVAAVFLVAWCGLCLAATAVPLGWRPAWLLGSALVVAVSGVLFGSRVNALAVALAPAATRGRHLAAFQYAFTVAGVLAPAVVALFDLGVWAPWVVVALCASVGAFGLQAFGRGLPDEVVRPSTVPAR
ncbi:MFS transporter [Actinophytocola oryzae]|uniref:MFS transporter n=1 Tax=Actinophytocola oryzae TaxID=502181 RepID=A0A4R7VD68_9PSEU|nr:MFS transporter [Actinophytocola oryzae]TDV46928.1 MFS transporter [Actinophytocola oryzae]